MRRAFSSAASLVFGAVWLAISGSACAGPEEPSDGGDVFRIPVTVRTDDGPVTFQAEVADTPAERNRGLMDRAELADDHGMLFLFPRPAQQSFWMKNTLIPLDIIFIRPDRTILGIVENAEPETLTSRRVPGLSQYVLEINGGLSSELGIAPGQRVEFMAPEAER
jgi:hypothetical protein